MKTVQMSARVNKAGQIELLEPLPEEFRSTEVEIVVLDAATVAAEREEERAWQRLGLEQFFKGYDEADSIYDDMR